MFCPQCGHELPDGANVCPSCGTPVPKRAQTAPTPQPASPPRAKAPSATSSSIGLIILILLSAALDNAYLLIEEFSIAEAYDGLEGIFLMVLFVLPFFLLTYAYGYSAYLLHNRDSRFLRQLQSKLPLAIVLCLIDFFFFLLTGASKDIVKAFFKIIVEAAAVLLGTTAYASRSQTLRAYMGDDVYLSKAIFRL